VAHRAGSCLLALVCIFTALAVACTGDGEATAAPEGKSQEPAATSTPEPTPTPWPILGRVFTKMEATCDLGLTGPELSVRYGAQIEGQAEITRVQLLVDKQVREDIRNLAEHAYLRETTIGTAANRMVTVELLVETRGAEPTPKTVHLVRCPRTPTLPRT
jgi:hypothetical protein